MWVLGPQFNSKDFMKSIYATIIVLLVANLVATVWFGVERNSSPASKIESENGLPEHIDKKVRDGIYEQFVNAYNGRDYDAMYNIFSDSAKAQIDKEGTFQVLAQLVEYFDSIEQGGFSHSEFLGHQGDMKQFKLVYPVKFGKNSKFGTTGNLYITIAVRDGEYGVWGFNLRSE